jgi:ParB family chromosome partitioning protein
MTTTVQTQSEYRDLPLAWLVISPTNPRKTFDEDAMQERAASIRENGVLQPLLVRPRAERSLRSYSESAGIVARRWPKKKQCRCVSAR